MRDLRAALAGLPAQLRRRAPRRGPSTRPRPRPATGSVIFPLILAARPRCAARCCCARSWRPSSSSSPSSRTYLAALGASWWLFTQVFGFAALDEGAPLLAVPVPGRARRRLQHLPGHPGPGGGAPARLPRGDAARPRGDRRRDHQRRDPAGGRLRGARRAAPRRARPDRRDHLRRGAARHARRPHRPRAGPRPDPRRPVLVAAQGSPGRLPLPVVRRGADAGLGERLPGRPAPPRPDPRPRHHAGLRDAVGRHLPGVHDPRAPPGGDGPRWDLDLRRRHRSARAAPDAAGVRLRLRARRSLRIFEWLDDDRIALIDASGWKIGSYVGEDLVVCRLSTGRCTVAVRRSAASGSPIVPEFDTPGSGLAERRALQGQAALGGR